MHVPAAPSVTRDSFSPPTPADPPHCLHIFPSFGIGGIQVQIASVLNHLGRRYRHTIIALDGVFDARPRLAAALDVTLLPIPHRKKHRIETILAFGRALRRLRPDLLLTYNWGAAEWAFMNTVSCRCRHIHSEHGFGPDEADRQVLRRVLFRRVALAGAARVVVPSLTLFKLASEHWRIPRAKLLHIPNGVDVGRFAAGPASPGIPGLVPASGGPLLGAIAPLRPEKNLGRLLRCFARVPRRLGARLAVIGDGPERPHLQQLATALGLDHRVVFVGSIDAPERVLRGLDVFAISSDTEQMPMAVLEAMAAGRAIVGVDVGDVKAMVSPENHPFIMPKTDEAALSNAMTQLLESSRLRTRLGSANHDHVRRHYDQQRTFTAYEALFEAVAPR